MKTLEQIQRAVQAARSLYDQKQGELNAAKAALKKEFGVTSKESAEILLAELQTAAEAAEAAFEESLEAFAVEFPELV